MSGLPDSVLETIQTLAKGYAHGQTQARNDLGLKAKRPNYKWVDETAFAAAAIEQGALMVHQLHELYERMLTDGTHVWRFGPGPDGSLSRQRVKPASEGESA